MLRLVAVAALACSACAKFEPTPFAEETEEIHNAMEMKGSVGGYMKFSTMKGMASKTGAIISASSYTLNMSHDVCQGGAAGSSWGFRDMGTMWSVMDLDLTQNSYTSIYYVVGDSMTESKEYEFKVPPMAGSTSEIEIIAYADQGVGYNDDSFNGRNNDNGIDALGVATGAINDIAGGFGDLIFIGGDVSYADGYLGTWEDYFDMMEPAVSTIPMLIGDGNHESAWFQATAVPYINSSASYSMDKTLVPPEVCIGTMTCPQPQYVGDGWAQWESLSSGGECGLAFKMIPLANTDQMSGKTWYSVAYGPVTVVHYSTERSMSKTSVQYQWLAQTLRSIDRTVTPWVIVHGHRATYVDVAFCAGNGCGDQDVMNYYQNLLDPLFTETKVDLVFFGHTHVSQRHCASYQGACMMNSTVDPATGYNVYDSPHFPVYYSIGNAGATSSANGQGQPTGTGRKFTAWESPRSAYTRMTINGSTLKVQYVDARSMAVLDTSVIKQASKSCVMDSTQMAPAENVLFVSIDGLHQGDLDYMVANKPNSRIVELLKGGIQYTNTNTSFPSDSFPGVANIITGASPRTHGFWYDVAYSRELYPPGSDCSGMPGTGVAYDESVDINFNGDLQYTVTTPDGGCPGYNFGNGCGINTAALPRKKMPDGSCVPWFAHQELRVNTIFEVARKANFVTGYADKHLVYEFANGPSGMGVEDLFTPDIQAFYNSGDWNATEEAMQFDRTHTDAFVNWINGRTAVGQKALRTDAKGFLVGGNYQAVSVAQKAWQLNWNVTQGGYVDASFTPSAVLAKALAFVDGEVGRIIDTLKATGKWDTTLVVLTAKHGQSPVNKTANRNIGNPAAIITMYGPADWTNDDSLLIWYHNQSNAAPSCQYIKSQAAALGATGPLAKIYCGAEVLALTGADPATDPKAPDIIVIPDPGVIYTKATATKRAEHGGNSVDDRHVGLILGGGVIKQPAKIGVPAQTNMLAPTMLRALGLNPWDLQGVVAENTQTLPGFFCREAGPPAACPAPAAEVCGVRVLTDPSATLKVDLKSDSALSSVTVWNVGAAGRALLQTPDQLAGMAVSIGSGMSMTTCAVTGLDALSMMGSSSMMGSTPAPMGGMMSSTPMPGMTGMSTPAPAPMPSSGMAGYAPLGLACGAHGRYLTVSMPKVAAAAPMPLGAVHVKVCVMPGADGSADANLWVQK